MLARFRRHAGGFPCIEPDVFQVLQNVALVMAEEMGLIDTIVERKGNNVTLAELSSMTGYEGNLIGIFAR